VDARSFGVEEELLLVEPGTGRARAVAGAVMRAAERQFTVPAGGNGAGGGETASDVLGFELKLEQLEINTKPCCSLDELGREVRRCRAMAAEAAGRAGVRVAAVGTSPVPVEPSLTSTPRYRRMAEAFGLTAREQLTCGCHVHVQIASDEEGVAVLDRIQPWLGPLLALSANSPFWQGRDSGYASFRYQVWGRWPCSGPTAWFGSAQAYHDTVQAMVGTNTVLDPGMVYFNARLSHHYPTIEVRIADVCLAPDDAVLIAALVRGLVETEARAWRASRPAHVVRTELLQLAAWRASRYGVENELIHPLSGRPTPVRAVTGALLDHVRPVLAETGDLAVVAGLIDAVLARGNGATFQRRIHRRAGNVLDVILGAVDRTCG